MYKLNGVLKLFYEHKVACTVRFSLDMVIKKRFMFIKDKFEHTENIL